MGFRSAADIFRTITIEGPESESFPQVDVLSGFPEAVAEEAHHRLDEALVKIPFRLTVVGPGKNLGDYTPYLNHSAGTKGGWGGPDPAHSAYQILFFGADGETLDGSKGAYLITTDEPQVDAFWSITAYDTERGGFLHPNDADRYHINNTTAVVNIDGTYTFLFKTSCGDEDENCLEVPAGPFDLAARFYLPSDEVISGE